MKEVEIVSTRLTRQQQQAQTRRMLLEAAAEMFTERGIGGSSLEQIAARAGLTKGAIYSNFASRDELVLTLLSQRPDQPDREYLQDILARDDEWAVKSADIAQLYQDEVHSERTQRFAIVFLESWLYAQRNRGAREPFAEMLRQWRSGLAAEAVIPSGSATGDEADAVAALLVAIDIGLAVQALMDDDLEVGPAYSWALGAILGLGSPGSTPGP